MTSLVLLAKFDFKVVCHEIFGNMMKQLGNDVDSWLGQRMIGCILTNVFVFL